MSTNERIEMLTRSVLDLTDELRALRLSEDPEEVKAKKERRLTRRSSARLVADSPARPAARREGAAQAPVASEPTSNKSRPSPLTAADVAATPKLKFRLFEIAGSSFPRGGRFRRHVRRPRYPVPEAISQIMRSASSRSPVPRSRFAIPGRQDPPRPTSWADARERSSRTSSRSSDKDESITAQSHHKTDRLHADLIAGSWPSSACTVSACDVLGAARRS
jgi:hypothetical protein